MDDKTDAVKKYLSKTLKVPNLEHKHDFDRNCETFRVSFNGDTALLKVSREFLDDNSSDDVIHRLEALGVADAMVQDKKQGVLVTARGLELFER